MSFLQSLRRFLDDFWADVDFAENRKENAMQEETSAGELLAIAEREAAALAAALPEAVAAQREHQRKLDEAQARLDALRKRVRQAEADAYKAQAADVARAGREADRRAVAALWEAVRCRKEAVAARREASRFLDQATSAYRQAGYAGDVSVDGLADVFTHKSFAEALVSAWTHPTDDQLARLAAAAAERGVTLK